MKVRHSVHYKSDYHTDYFTETVESLHMYNQWNSSPFYEVLNCWDIYCMTAARVIFYCSFFPELYDEQDKEDCKYA